MSMHHPYKHRQHLFCICCKEHLFRCKGLCRFPCFCTHGLRWISPDESFLEQLYIHTGKNQCNFRLKLLCNKTDDQHYEKVRAGNHVCVYLQEQVDVLYFPWLSPQQKRCRAAKTVCTGSQETYTCIYTRREKNAFMHLPKAVTSLLTILFIYC